MKASSSGFRWAVFTEAALLRMGEFNEGAEGLETILLPRDNSTDDPGTVSFAAEVPLRSLRFGDKLPTCVSRDTLRKVVHAVLALSAARDTNLEV